MNYHHPVHNLTNTCSGHRCAAAIQHNPQHGCMELGYNLITSSHCKFDSFFLICLTGHQSICSAYPLYLDLFPSVDVNASSSSGYTVQMMIVEDFLFSVLQLIGILLKQSRYLERCFKCPSSNVPAEPKLRTSGQMATKCADSIHSFVSSCATRAFSSRKL